MKLLTVSNNLFTGRWHTTSCTCRWLGLHVVLSSADLQCNKLLLTGGKWNSWVYSAYVATTSLKPKVEQARIGISLCVTLSIIINDDSMMNYSSREEKLTMLPCSDQEEEEAASSIKTACINVTRKTRGKYMVYSTHLMQQYKMFSELLN